MKSRASTQCKFIFECHDEGMKQPLPMTTGVLKALSLKMAITVIDHLNPRDLAQKGNFNLNILFVF